MGTMRIAIVEDHSLTRTGIRSSLNEQQDISVVGEAETGVAGLRLLQRTSPDLAIVDIGLPDMDGIEVVQRFRNALPPESDVSTRFIMLTSYTQERMVLAAFAAGADSYCVKNTKFELLLEAIRMTYEGQSWIDPAIARIVLKHARQSALPPSSPNEPQTVTINALDSEQATILESDPLTKKELEVLELMVQGYTNNQIAQQLYMSLGTAKVHIRSILNKLCASDRTQAAVLAMRAGLIE
ncbi:MAG: response regulator transcription factor [Leptolyngbyaceae cyanobacterium SM1_4_3]|nr:response regulator transcription factor [Leptolyngbyaceae cyanobacterium SM1_4_3]